MPGLLFNYRRVSSIIIFNSIKIILSNYHTEQIVIFVYEMCNLK